MRIQTPTPYKCFLVSELVYTKLCHRCDGGDAVEAAPWQPHCSTGPETKAAWSGRRAMCTSTSDDSLSVIQISEMTNTMLLLSSA